MTESSVDRAYRQIKNMSCLITFGITFHIINRTTSHTGRENIFAVKRSLCFYHLDYFINLNRAGNVETLLHARDVKLDHSQVFAFDDDASQRPHKSEREANCEELWGERHKNRAGTVVQIE